LVRAGVRTTFADAVTRIDAPQGISIDPATLRFSILANDGSIVLVQPNVDPTQDHTWLFKDGVLTYLWQGNPFDVNSSGTVMGQVWHPETWSYHDVLRAADGTITEITTP